MWILVAFLGVFNILSAIFPILLVKTSLVENFLPYNLHAAVRLGTALIGFILITVSGGLRKKKKIAWTVSVGALIISLIFHFFRDIELKEIVVTSLLLWYLYKERKKFIVEPDLPSIFQGIRALIFSILFTGFYGTIGLYLFERRLNMAFSLRGSFDVTIKMFLLSSAPPHFINKFSFVFFDSIYLIGFLTIGYAIYMFFKSVIYSNEISREEGERKRLEILKKYGRSAVGSKTTNSKRNVFFSKSEKAFLTYLKFGSYILVTGEPIGPDPEVRRLIEEFRRFTTANAATLIFEGITLTHKSFLKRLGFKFIKIGHEAIINLKIFDVIGADKKPMRYSLNVMPKKGYTFKVLEPPIDPKSLQILSLITDEWSKKIIGGGKDILENSFDENDVVKDRVAIVVDSKGEIVAFTNFYDYGPGRIGISLMCHKTGVPPDTMIFLFTSLILWAKENGYEYLSLGLAPLYGLGGKKSRVIEKTLKIIFEKFNRVYNFKGLYIFKSKFHPDWEERYVVYSGAMELSEAILSAIRQEIWGNWKEKLK